MSSVDLEGVRAEEIKKSVAAELQEELRHAQKLAKRIKVLGVLLLGDRAAA